MNPNHRDNDMGPGFPLVALTFLGLLGGAVMNQISAGVFVGLALGVVAAVVMALRNRAR